MMCLRKPVVVLALTLCTAPIAFDAPAQQQPAAASALALSGAGAQPPAWASPGAGQLDRLAQAPGSGPDANVSAVAGAGRADPDAAIRRAGQLARDANRHFDQLMPIIGGDSSAHSSGSSPARMAQSKQAAPPLTSLPSSDDDVLAPMWAWLEKSNRQYQTGIVRQLSTGGPAAHSLADGAGRPGSEPSRTDPDRGLRPGQASREMAAGPATRPGAPPSAGSEPGGDAVRQVTVALQDWFTRANRQYNTVIVMQLAERGTTTVAAASPPTPPTPPASMPASRREAPPPDRVRSTVAPPPATQPPAAQPESRPVAKPKPNPQQDPTEAAQSSAGAADDIRQREDRNRSQAAEPSKVQQASRKEQSQRDEAERRRLIEQNNAIAAGKVAEADRQRLVRLAEAERQQEEARGRAAAANRQEQQRLAEQRRKAEEATRMAAASAERTRRAEEARRAEQERQTVRQTQARTQAEQERLAIERARQERLARQAREQAEEAVRSARLVAAARRKELDSKSQAQAEIKAQAQEAQRLAATRAAAPVAGRPGTEAASRFAQARKPPVVTIVPAPAEPKRAAASPAATGAGPEVRAPATAKSARPTAPRTVRGRSNAGSRAWASGPRQPAVKVVKRGVKSRRSGRPVKRSRTRSRAAACRFGVSLGRISGPGYVMRLGDTRSTIADRIYGDGGTYLQLLLANPVAIGDPNSPVTCPRIGVPQSI